MKVVRSGLIIDVLKKESTGISPRLDIESE